MTDRSKILSLLTSPDSIKLGLILNQRAKCFPILAKLSRKRKVVDYNSNRFYYVFYPIIVILHKELLVVERSQIKKIINCFLVYFDGLYSMTDANFMINNGGCVAHYKRKLSNTRILHLRTKYGKI